MSTDWKYIVQQNLDSGAKAYNDNDVRFAKSVYKDGLQKYRERLAAISFSGKRKILDAGCGFGQWSLALAEDNREIYSCDVSSGRIDFIDRMCRHFDIENVYTSCGTLTELPYGDDQFDAVFCYGAIFCTPWKQSLLELARVLAPGGMIYLTFNEIGWYVYLWKTLHNRTCDYDPRMVAADALTKTLVYEDTGVFDGIGDLIIQTDEILNEMRLLGFEDITIGPEGSLGNADDLGSAKPFFEGEYFGLPGVCEVIGRLI